MQKMLIFMLVYNCLYKHQCQWYSDGDKVLLGTFSIDCVKNMIVAII